MFRVSMDCREILSGMVLQQNPRPLHLAQLAKENLGATADQENRSIPRMSTRDATAIAANATNFASTTTSGPLKAPGRTFRVTKRIADAGSQEMREIRGGTRTICPKAWPHLNPSAPHTPQCSSAVKTLLYPVTMPRIIPMPTSQ